MDNVSGKVEIINSNNYCTIDGVQCCVFLVKFYRRPHGQSH